MMRLYHQESPKQIEPMRQLPDLFSIYFESKKDRIVFLLSHGVRASEIADKLGVKFQFISKCWLSATKYSPPQNNLIIT